MNNKLRLTMSKWLLFALIISSLIAGLAPESVAGDWFKSVFKQKSTGPVSYAEALANVCYAPQNVSVTPLAMLPGADVHQTPVIYPQKKPEAFNIAISPDGKHIATSDFKGYVSLWEKGSGRQVWSALVHPKGGRAALDLAFSPDGSKLFSLGSDQQGILVLDPTNSKVVDHLPFGTCEFPGQRGQVFSAQGTVALVNGDFNKSILVELATCKQVQEFKGAAIAISPSGHRVATTVSVWDACSGRPQKWVFKEGDTSVTSNGAFSPDGSRLALWTPSHQLVLLDTATGKRLWEGPRTAKELGGSGPFCNQLHFSGDGQHLFFHGSYPPLTRPAPWSILALDAEKGKVVKVFADKWRGMGGGLAVTPDGRSLAMGYDPGIVFLDEKTLETIETIQGHTRAFPFSVNAQDAIVTPFHQWDPQTAQPVKTFGLPEELIFYQIGLSPDGNILTAAGSDIKMTECRIIRLDARSGKVLSEVVIPAPKIKAGTGRLLAITLSPGGQYIALASDSDRTVIYDVHTGRQISVIQHLTYTTSAQFSGDDKFMAASHTQDGSYDFIGIWDIQSGKMVRELDLYKIGAYFSLSGMAFSPGNGTLLVTGTDHEKGYVRALLDTRTGAVIWKHIDPAGRGQQSIRYRARISPDGKTALARRSDGYLALMDMASGRILREFEGGFTSFGVNYAFSPDALRIYGSQYNSGELRIWDARTGKHLARIMEFVGGEWLSMTPEGYYASSDKAGQYLNVRVGLFVQGVDQYYEVFYRPDLVADNLKRDGAAPAGAPEPKKNLLQVAAIGTPPRVLFQAPANKATVSQRDIEAAVEVIDTGGGIGKVEWKINGVTVGITEDAGRGITIAGTGKQAANRVSLKQLLTLSPGENVIQVIASNATNEITSVPALLNLTCRDEISATPSLYLLTVGINKYRDGSLRLTYSVPDAQSVSQALDARSRTIFKKIIIEQVFDEKATMEGIQAAFEKISRQVQTQDVFVFYVAGHGVAQAGRFHLLPYDFRYRNEKSIRNKGITQDQIQKWLASIPARKSLILMDTCNSGAFTRTKVKQRGIAEKTAINRLTRATGRAIIVASKDDQVAMEGYKGHGVFTYVLLNALKEADQSFGNRDGQTSIFELAAYIDEQVPEISFRQFGYEQVPQVNMQGRDFPIAITP